tara:strand:+ start:1753 stop:2346 length:594 start_codon:yes stop_codon:yes gene_type:complete
MKITEIINEDDSWKIKDPKTVLTARFLELGIDAAERPLLEWILEGQFRIPANKMDRYEQTFWLINSILPDDIIESYSKLPMMYRGFKPKSREDLDKIYNGGLPIYSKIASWAPYNVALNYYYPDVNGVLLHYQPKGPEVIFSLTKDTCDFLHLQEELIVNYMETILSLPILKITPDLVAAPYRHPTSWARNRMAQPN